MPLLNNVLITRTMTEKSQCLCGSAGDKDCLHIDEAHCSLTSKSYQDKYGAKYRPLLSSSPQTHEYCIGEFCAIVCRLS